MIIRLVEMPATLKGPNDAAYKGMVPRRMRYLSPDAGPKLMAIEKATGGFIYTDMWRSPESSLQARRIKRGVQRPGYSSHGFGMAIDLDLEAIMKKYRFKYPQIVEIMKAHGWYCHRRDGLGPEEMEAWHFNYLGEDPQKYLSKTDINSPKTWSSAAEARILERYGLDFVLSSAQILGLLAQLRFYSGELDEPITSSLCRESVMAFQRAWDLDVDGDAGPMTQRTLAFVTSTRQITSLNPNS